MLDQEKFEVDLFTSLVRSYALCNATQVECLMLANELPAAHNAANVIGQNYQALFDDLNPSSLATKSIPHQKGWDERDFNRLRDVQLGMNNLVQGVRDMTDANLTKPYLIDTLMERQISGYEYIKSLQNENEQPILLLPTNT